ncbi:MAG: sigma-54-dependent transcriptional regulator [Planctomycetota bacterium]
MAARILLLAPATPDRLRLARALRGAAPRGSRVEAIPALPELLLQLEAGLPVDLVVVDYDRGDGERGGAEVLRALQAQGAAPATVAVVERGDVELAAEVTAAGASDLLVRGDRLAARVKTLLAKIRSRLDLQTQNRILGEQNRLLREAHEDRWALIGESPQIRAVAERVLRVARIPRPVLIVGERGTGKELVARAIHRAAFPDRPIVAVNCAAFPDALLESELFGHEKGAFTGADGIAHGKFEQAHGGTLFLDEVGHMSLPFQQKVLRAVEYGTFTRVGGRAEIEVSVRIIAATNADLGHKLEAGEFLRDLYDRLSFEVIRVPPLREREGDVELLARHFLARFAAEIPALQGKHLARSTFEQLHTYPFPGNVRELKTIIERAAYRDTTNEITPEDVGLLPQANGAGAATPRGGFGEEVEAFKRRLILEALERAEGNQARAARLLKLSYHQYRYFLRKYSQG